MANSEIRSQRVQDSNTEMEIDVLALAIVVLKRWKLLILVAILCGAAGYGGSKLLIKPTYRSAFTAYINNNENRSETSSVTTADISASRNLASTYSQIIRSKPNIQAAIEKAGLNVAYGMVNGGVSVGALNNTEIIQVSVITKDPDTSYRIASALEEVSPNYVAGIVKGSSMVIVTHAEMPNGRYSPSYSRNAIIAALLGVLLVVAWIAIRYLTDSRVRTPDDLAERYGLVVIGTIHDLAAQSSHGYYGYEKGESENNGKKE